MRFQKLLFIFVPMILLHSCSIERRMHRPGLHIDVWNANQASKTVIHDDKSRPEPMEAAASLSPRPLPQLTENEIIRSLNPLSTQKRNDPDTCDVLVTKRGRVYSVRSIRFTLKDVFFVECPSGRRHDLPVSHIQRIEYRDGNVRDFSSEQEVSARKEVIGSRVLSDLALSGTTLAIGAVAAAFSMAIIISVLSSSPLAVLIIAILFLLAGLAGLVLSILGIRDVNRNSMEKKGKPMSVIGFILSIVSIVFWFVLMLISAARL